MYVVLILCVLWCVYALFTGRMRNVNAQKLPPAYPGALPIIGHTHLLLLWMKDIYGCIKSMADFCLESGGVTCGYFGGVIYYAVVDPEDAATVANTLLQKHPFYKFGEPWLGKGLVTSSGALYKRHRRLLLPAFSLPAVHGFLDVFNDQYRRLTDVFDNQAGRGPFDPLTTIRDITLRTSCNRTVVANKPDIVVIDLSERRTMIIDVTIPHDGNLAKAEKDKQIKYLNLAREVVDMWDVDSAIIVPIVISVNGLIAKSLDHHLKRLALGAWFKGLMQKAVLLDTARILSISGILTTVTVFGDNDEKDNDFINTYSRTIDAIFDIVMLRIERYWLHSDFFFQFTSLKRKQDKLIQLLDEIAYEVIQRKKSDMKNKENIGTLPVSEGSCKPFLDAMLEIAADGSLTDQEIRDELNTVVAGSFETTSQQLCFICVFVGSYPEVQEKMYREIMEVVGDKNVEKQDLPKLVYTESVIKECLRLVPPIPLLGRCVDDDLKLKNYTLRAGSHVLLIPSGIHRHSTWGPDAEAFRPERWLDKEMSSKLTSLYFAFSFGTRSCVGRKYAYVSLKVAMVHIIRQFRLRADHTKMKLKIDVATRPLSGHEITIERRTSKYDLNQNLTVSFLNENTATSHGI